MNQPIGHSPTIASGLKGALVAGLVVASLVGLAVFLLVLVDDDDGDGVLDAVDNCQYMKNGPGDPENQLDSDGDFHGDICDSEPNNPAVWK